MSVLASILISSAARVGADTVKVLLEKYVRGTASDIGGVLIDKIAGQAGVPADKLQDLPQHELDAAIVGAERNSAELVLACVEQQRETNKLLLAEMQQENAFGWLWRPAGMWLMLACVVWYLFLHPVLNAILWYAVPGLQIDLGLDHSLFLTIFVTYTGLYMSGNTVIRAVGKR